MKTWAQIVEDSLILADKEYKLKFVEFRQNEDKLGRIQKYFEIMGYGKAVKQPWCAIFPSVCLLLAGMSRKDMPVNPASACNWIVWGRQHDLTGGIPKRGDMFGWCRPASWTGHLGRVLEVLSVPRIGYYKVADGSRKFFWAKGTYIRTIEGNSNDDPKNREGVKIVKRWRMVTDEITIVRLTDLKK
jgi:hypothetical protein